jgi:DNA primase
MIGPEEMADLIGKRVKLQRVGKNLWRALCPFHLERTPSLFVFADRKDGRGRFRCYGCGAWGDGADWLRRVEHKAAGWKPDPEITRRRALRRQQEEQLRELLNRHPDSAIPYWMILTD